MVISPSALIINLNLYTIIYYCEESFIRVSGRHFWEKFSGNADCNSQVDVCNLHVNNNLLTLNTGTWHGLLVSCVNFKVVGNFDWFAYCC